MEDRWLSIAAFCLFVSADIFIVLTVSTYAIEALKWHKHTDIPHKEVTCSVGLKSIHNETMSDHSMFFWANKHRDKLLNDIQAVKYNK